MSAYRLISVPHTGTVFTRELLNALGVEHTSHHTDEFDLRAPIFDLNADKIVVPIRDPMLAEISRIKRGSGLPVQEWLKITDLAGRENVHWFEVPPTPTAIAELAYFFDVHSFSYDDLDLAPKNVRPDHHDLLGGYLSGDLDEQLLHAYNWLRSTDEVYALFEYLGLWFPWMEDRWL